MFAACIRQGEETAPLQTHQETNEFHQGHHDRQKQIANADIQSQRRKVHRRIHFVLLTI